MTRKKYAILLILLVLVILSGVSMAAKMNSENKIQKNEVKKEKPVLQTMVKTDKDVLVDPELKKAKGKTRVIVQSDSDVKGMQKIGKGVYAAEIDSSDVQQLTATAGVKKVWVDRQKSVLLNVSVPLIEAPAVWSAGINGTGIKVCVVDTGVNATHPALYPRVIASADFTTENNTNDGHGHGTHAAGIVASSDQTYRGVAPGVSILSAKVLTSAGSGYDSWIVSGIDWCLANDAKVITMSLGGVDSAQDGSDPLSMYLDYATDQGAVVIVAAGNSGPGGTSDCRTSDSTGNYYSICSPALSHKAITVGSTQTGKSETTKDLISSFSSHGPTSDGRIKPDVVAPGQPITSAYTHWQTSSSFISSSGTSMSAPHVAGLAALILQANNTLKPAQIKALIMDSVYDYGVFTKDSAYGAGRINASRAIQEIGDTTAGTIRNTKHVYNIYAAAGTEIRSTLYWSESSSQHSDIDLYLYDPSGMIRARSDSYNNTDEMVKFTSDVTGYWKLVADPFAVLTSQDYALAANIKPSYQMFGFFGNTTGTVFHSINVSSSTYGSLGSSASFRVNLDWNSAGPDMNLYIYSPSGQLVNYSAGSGNHEEVSATGTGIFTVKVESPAIVSYSLTSDYSIANQSFDTATPSVVLVSPVNRTYGSPTLFAITASDDMNLKLDCYKNLDNDISFITSLSGNYSSSMNLTSGQHAINVTCYDATNKSSTTQTVIFNVDAAPPEIYFISPSDAASALVKRNYTNITVLTNDNSGLDTCTLRWNGVIAKQALTGTNTTCSFYKEDMDGTYNYMVTINDSRGNVNSTNRTITFDTTAPIIVMQSPSGFYNTNNLSLNFTSQDSHPDSLWYSLDNATPVVISSNITLTAAEGSHSIVLWANDTMGNTDYVSSLFSVDTVLPSIAFASPTPNNEIINSSGSVLINVTFSESVTALLEWNGTNETFSGTKQKTGLTNGNYTFKVYAADNAGNTNFSEERWVYIDALKNVSLSSIVVSPDVSTVIIDQNGNAADPQNLLKFLKYDMKLNKSGIIIDINDFLPSDLNDSSFINTTKNITLSSVISSFASAGGSVDDYIWVDMNDILPNGGYTPRVSFPRPYTIYFYLNGTKESPQPVRIQNLCDANASNVPCYNDSTVFLPSFSGAAGGNDTQTPSVSVQSPAGGATFTSSSVSLSYTVSDNVGVDKCSYRLNGGATPIIVGCANITITAVSGTNALTVYVNDTSGNSNSVALSFTYSPSQQQQSNSNAGSNNNLLQPVRNTTNQTNPTPKSTLSPETVLEGIQPVQNTQINEASNETQNNTENTDMSSPATGFVISSPAAIATGVVVFAGAVLGYFFRGKILGKKKK